MPRRTGRRVAGPAEYGESWIARSLISRRCKPPSTGKTSVTGAVPCAGITDLPAQPSGHRAMPGEGIQGDEWAAYVPLDTYHRDERGIAYRTRVLWRRRPRCDTRSQCAARRRHLPGGVKGPAAGLSQQAGEAGGSSAVEMHGSGGKRPRQRRNASVLPDGPGPASETRRCT